jgi:ABC-2 type transport system ATP-binding protein
VGLENRINDKVSKYSLGMRQRLGIAQAIINKPNLLILDEPTNGLDPEGIRDLRNFLVKLAKEENMAIFISSHNLAELESFCTKVCIIKNGKVIENASMSDLKIEKNNDGSIYEVEVDNAESVKTIDEYKDYNFELIDNTHFRVTMQKEKVPEYIESLLKHNIKVYEFKEEKLSLEEAFLKRTGGNVIG